MSTLVYVARKSAFFLLLLVAWFLLANFGPWPPHLFPGPEAVLRAFIKMALDGRLLRATIRSLGRMSQGYLISIAIGVPLGVATARLKLVRDSVKPVLMGFQGLPSVCWLPLALLWFGLTDAAIEWWGKAGDQARALLVNRYGIDPVAATRWGNCHPGS